MNYNRAQMNINLMVMLVIANLNSPVSAHAAREEAGVENQFVWAVLHESCPDSAALVELERERRILQKSMRVRLVWPKQAFELLSPKAQRSLRGCVGRLSRKRLGLRGYEARIRAGWEAGAQAGGVFFPWQDDFRSADASMRWLCSPRWEQLPDIDKICRGLENERWSETFWIRYCVFHNFWNWLLFFFLISLLIKPLLWVISRRDRNTTTRSLFPQEEV